MIAIICKDFYQARNIIRYPDDENASGIKGKIQQIRFAHGVIITDVDQYLLCHDERPEKYISYQFSSFIIAPGAEHRHELIDAIRMRVRVGIST